MNFKIGISSGIRAGAFKFIKHMVRVFKKRKVASDLQPRGISRTVSYRENYNDTFNHIHKELTKHYPPKNLS